MISVASLKDTHCDFNSVGQAYFKNTKDDFPRQCKAIDITHLKKSQVLWSSLNLGGKYMYMYLPPTIQIYSLQC